MLTRTPLAVAAMGVFCAPFATSAVAQTNESAAPVAASSVAASSVAATPTGSVPADAQTLPEVSVTGQSADQPAFQTYRTNITKGPEDVHDIPQAVTIVNQQLLQSQGVTSFSDALRNVPGVTIGAAEGGAIGNNINLRGFTANNDIYLDGFRDRGQYYRDTFDIESIDVLYGPSSLYFGRGSTGGVINQVTKQANLKKSASVSTTIGTDDHYRTSVDFNQPLTDTSAFRINAFGQSLHSTRDVMSNKDYGIAPTVSFGIGTPNEFTLSALVQHNRDMAYYGLQSVNGRPAPVGKSAFYGFTDDRTMQDTQTVTGRYTHRFDNGFVLRNEAQFSHSSTDARETGLKRGLFTGPFANSPQLGAGNFTDLPLSSLYLGLVSRDRVIDNHSIYDSIDVSGTLGSGWMKHKVVAGVDFGHETYSNQGYLATTPGLPSGTLAIVPLLNPAYTSRPANAVETPGNLAESTANSIGIYANDTVLLGEHWKVVGGVRWDRFQASVTNSTTSPGYASQTNFFTSVRTGIVYQPTDWQSYYFSYGTSFDPSLEALTLTSGTQNLSPEHSQSYEIGSKWDLLDGNVSVSQSLFQIDQTNTRTQNGDGTYTLDGDTRVRGYQIGAAGRIGNKWQVYGGYTYLDGVIEKARDGTQGNTLPNTPRHMVTLWLTYKPTSHWEIGGGPIYMSSRYPATDNVVKVPSYVRFDAMAAYHAKRYDVQLNLLNLTNKLYYDQLIQSDGGRAVPGIGRTLLATFNYRFY